MTVSLNRLKDYHLKKKQLWLIKKKTGESGTQGETLNGRQKMQYLDTNIHRWLFYNKMLTFLNVTMN